MKEAINSDRTTVCNAIKDAGQRTACRTYKETIMAISQAMCTSFKRNY